MVGIDRFYMVGIFNCNFYTVKIFDLINKHRTRKGFYPNTGFVSRCINHQFYNEFRILYKFVGGIKYAILLIYFR